MKIKPLYIYLGVVLIAIVALIVFSNMDNDQEKTAVNGQMPNDEIHQGMGDPNNPHGGGMADKMNHALEQMKKKYEENPNDTLAARQYAEYLAMAHQPDNAIPIYEKLLNKDSKRTDIRNSLAYLYLLKQDFNKSEEVLKGVLKYDKDNAQAKFNLGIIAVESGNKQKAKEIWTAMIKENPNAPLSKRAEEAIKDLKM